MIRKANISDVFNVLELILKFKEESLGFFPVSYDDKSMIETITYLIKNHIVLIADGAVVMGMIQPSIFDKNEIIGQEIMWYVSPENRGKPLGVKILKRFISECKNLGIRKIILAHMSNSKSEKLKQFYNKIGFKEMETQYIKEV